MVVRLDSDRTTVPLGVPSGRRTPLTFPKYLPSRQPGQGWWPSLTAARASSRPTPPSRGRRVVRWVRPTPSMVSPPTMTWKQTAEEPGWRPAPAAQWRHRSTAASSGPGGLCPRVPVSPPTICRPMDPVSWSSAERNHPRVMSRWLTIPPTVFCGRGPSTWLLSDCRMLTSTASSACGDCLSLSSPAAMPKASGVASLTVPGTGGKPGPPSIFRCLQRTGSTCPWCKVLFRLGMGPSMSAGRVD